MLVSVPVPELTVLMSYMTPLALKEKARSCSIVETAETRTQHSFAIHYSTSYGSHDPSKLKCSQSGLSRPTRRRRTVLHCPFLLFSLLFCMCSTVQTMPLAISAMSKPLGESMLLLLAISYLLLSAIAISAYLCVHLFSISATHATPIAIPHSSRQYSTWCALIRRYRYPATLTR